MTEDPREFGLTAADLRTAADQLYPPADPRLGRTAGTWGEAAQFGRIRSRLRGLADAIDPQEGTPMTEDHHRPDIPEQRAVLAAARAMLQGSSPDQLHHAAEGGDCPACATLAAVSFGFAIAQQLAGAGFVNGPLAPRLLTWIDQTEADLNSMGN